MTTQIRDRLIFNGEEYFLNKSLLERFFGQFPQKRPKIEISSTALWRGFVATYEIAESKLFINDVEIFSGTDLDMKSIIDDVCIEREFSWYSGLIRIDDFRGEFDNLPENGIFEFLEIRDGNFIQKRIYNFTELQNFIEQQYQLFILTDEADIISNLWRKNNPGITDEEITGYI